MYEIELADPTSYRCDCCGGLSVSLTRYVRRDGDAFAVYYAHYANNHPDDELAMLISLGDWGSDDVPTLRVAFYCRVRPVDGSYDVMLGDAAESAWSDVAIVGRKLSAEEARAHPRKQIAFGVLDEAFRSDPSLRGFVARAQCGNPRAPLERSFAMPDEVFALGEQREGRAVVQGPFAQLDKRYFVRVNEPPRICATGQLALLLSHPWSRERFEEYALERGFSEAQRFARGLPPSAGSLMARRPVSTRPAKATREVRHAFDVLPEHVMAVARVYPLLGVAVLPCWRRHSGKRAFESRLADARDGER